ncbi:thioredoxin family protein [Longibacter salinarum]|uniref:Thioredoxin family protein n=1 Tax=Longibacter salinarum TaxID=1850348 RepID=A0A2A8CYG6_9BACT|nr:thioredoxin family protein [Longibacter salinarum]PEN13735.1 thioredoxin family protein [Longibacter salinarum]
MAVTESKMAELGTPAPTFELPIANPGVDDLQGTLRALEDYDNAEAVVIVFMCNHCPYVKHIEDAMVDVANEYQDRGVQFIGICSNDAEKYPADGFERMTERAMEKSFPFPYLQDESQNVAREYGALCTPDIFVYDQDRDLVYRGRFDETRPNNGEAHGGDLKKALDELLDSGTIEMEQHPSMGCNIKWKPGKAPSAA